MVRPAARPLEFYYDFGSPNVYLAWKALSRVDGLALELKPALIGGLFKGSNNQPPWQAFAGVPSKMRYMMAEIERFAKMYDIPFAMNPHFPVNTLLAMRAAIVAHEDHTVDVFYPAVQAAMWEAGRDISKPDVLADVLDAVGLLGAAMVERTQSPDIKQALIDVTQTALERGLFGLPTWFDEGEMYFGKENSWMFGAEPVTRS